MTGGRESFEMGCVLLYTNYEPVTSIAKSSTLFNRHRPQSRDLDGTFGKGPPCESALFVFKTKFDKIQKRAHYLGLWERR